jgi:hypothetical protein
MQAAAESSELAAVVSEGAGTRVFGEEMQDAHGLERILCAAVTRSDRRGRDLLEHSAAVTTHRSRPEDREAALPDLGPQRRQPGDDEPKYYRLAKGPKQIWAMPTAKHVRGIYATSPRNMSAASLSSTAHSTRAPEAAVKLRH